jgi:hypothetical protein
MATVEGAESQESSPSHMDMSDRSMTASQLSLKQLDKNLNSEAKTHINKRQVINNICKQT